MGMHPPGSDLCLSDPALLETIDKLFACNVGSYVDLPQLVVVGDQSSGKSSVLEGLTRLAFPRDSGLCTRFATQIIFRRSVSERRIMASIIPSHDIEGKDEAKLRSWKAKDLQSLDLKSFSQMMAEVHTLMGVSQSENDGLPTFSKHVLQVEIIGPKEEHLSVIDVPGIFSNAIPGKTTKEDKIVVRKMVQGYMKNPRSIILTVVPANVDIATQEIVEMAHEVDPHGERTLGVLTKPDLVDKGAESAVIDIIKGKRMQVKLGWVIVRNLGQSELHGGITGRDIAEEDLRMNHPWNTVDNEDFGIIALKTRIRMVVTVNARQAFTSVKYDISNSLKTRQASLRSLGPPRKTMEQQGQFLVDVLSSFQNLTKQALLGNYSLSDAFEDLEILRLATEVVTRNEKFSDDVARWGHLFEFNNGSLSQGTNEILSKPQKPQVSQLSSRNQKDIPELLDVLPEPSDLSPPLTHDLASWIGDEYRQSRGFEIGTFNPLLLSGLMKKQSLKWKALADGYIGDVIAIVHSYITNGLRQVCPDQRVYRNLLSFLMDRLLERYQTAIDKTNHLLFVERSMTPMTLNHYLNDNIEKCRQKRATSMVANKAIESPNGRVIRLDDVKFQQNMSNVEHVVQTLEDILQSYYKVARKRFVDNVCIEACGYHLLEGPISPLELFTPSLVGRLSTEQLEQIAGEDEILKRSREKLHQEIAELSAAKRIML